jgi:hypothetical protein
MAVLSRKTCSVAIQLLDARLTRTYIELLFYEVEIPNHILKGSSKTELLLNVFRHFEDQQDYERLVLLIQAALKRLPPEDRKTLEVALLRDGFVSGDDDVVPDENLAQEHKTALERLVEKHIHELTAATLLHHLHEAEELFRLEKWDASIGQARNFVEQLLTDIARHSANQKHESPDLSRPVRIRDYLQRIGFFDEGERKKLVDGVYGYFSEEGSHPGIGVQSSARVCLSILWNFGFYVLEKLENGHPNPK